MEIRYEWEFKQIHNKRFIYRTFSLSRFWITTFMAALCLYTQKKENVSKESKNLEEDKFPKLHNQRRLLSYFFWQLNSCAKDSPSLKRKIKKEFTVNEAYICKILICMNKVLEDNPKIFKDISSIKYEKISGIRGINKSLFDFHNLLKNQNRWSD